MVLTMVQPLRTEGSAEGKAALLLPSLLSHLSPLSLAVARIVETLHLVNISRSLSALRGLLASG